MFQDVDETLRAVLLADVPIKKAEVDIAFDRPTREAILERLLGALSPEGFLFLGSTEAPDAGSNRFMRVPDGAGGWCYRRLDAPPLEQAA